MSMASMPCSSSCFMWSGSARLAKRPPWMTGCSVFTRPPINPIPPIAGMHVREWACAQYHSRRGSRDGMVVMMVSSSGHARRTQREGQQRRDGSDNGEQW